MSYITALYPILAVIVTIIVAIIIGSILPGFERKYIHARIQQRVGPSVLSPGLFSILKFLFKKDTTVKSSSPGLYKSLPIICLLAIILILITLTPENYVLLSFASIIAIVGFLKLEEICYVLMGALSKSVMSGNMPFEDKVIGSKRPETNVSFLEDLSSNRSIRLIVFGSFPLYLSLFIPVVLSKSIYLTDIVRIQQLNGPFFFTVPGIIGTIVFLIGYIILLNEYPFNILKAKADVIEGPYMEYSSDSRAFVYLNKGLLMFTLAALFSVLYLGLPLNILSWKILITIIVSFIFPVLAGILGAFSPVFTFRQFYPVVIVSSLLGVLGIIISLFII